MSQTYQERAEAAVAVTIRSTAGTSCDTGFSTRQLLTEANQMNYSDDQLGKELGLRNRLNELTVRHAENFQILTGIIADRQAGVHESSLVPRAKDLHRLVVENRRDFLRLQVDVINWELSLLTALPNSTSVTGLTIPDFLLDNF